MTTAEPTSGTGRWLIDGNNVMGSRPDGWWRDRLGAKARLADEIGRWSRSAGQPTVLFFDGRGDDAIRAAAERGAAGGGSDRGGTFELRFAGAGRRDAADDAIVAEARAGDTVVTADRGLIDRLAFDVAVQGPRSLLARLPSNVAAAADDEEGN